MTVSWEPARQLVGRLGGGMDAVWSLLYAAQTASLRLALVGPVDGEIELTEAGMDLADALGELEWVRPELVELGVAVDPGPAPLDDLPRSRETLVVLLAAAIELIVALLQRGPTDGASPSLSPIATASPSAVTAVGSVPRSVPDVLSVADVLALARVAHLVATAHGRVTGRPA